MKSESKIKDLKMLLNFFAFLAGFAVKNSFFSGLTDGAGPPGQVCEPSAVQLLTKHSRELLEGGNPFFGDADRARQKLTQRGQ